MKKKKLYIRIEFYQREFKEKLLIAMIAASRGYQVIIGEQHSSVFNNASNGIVLHKDHAKWSKDILIKYMSNNMKVCAIDEEALIIGSDDEYLNSRCSKYLLDNLDAVFCWGKKQYAILNKVSSVKTNKYIVGSPKFDLTELKKGNKYNKTNPNVLHVLVNTRFSFYNNTFEDGVNGLREQFKDLGYINSDSSLEYFEDLVREDKIIFDEFIRLIEYLSNNDKFQVSIRPHPAENADLYTGIIKNLNNIIVDNSTDLRKQICLHDCVIHDGCTTAIEARALDVPVFGLRPPGLHAYDEYSNNYSLNFFSALDLYKYLLNVDRKKYQQPDIDDFSHEGIHNWKGAEKFASVSIVDIFDQFTIRKMNLIKPGIRTKINYKKIIYCFLINVGLAYKIVNLLFPKSLERFISGMKTVDNKFPDLSPYKVKLEMTYLAKNCNECIGDISKYNVSLLSGKVFLIYTK